MASSCKHRKYCHRSGCSTVMARVCKDVGIELGPNGTIRSAEISCAMCGRRVVCKTGYMEELLFVYYRHYVEHMLLLATAMDCPICGKDIHTIDLTVEHIATMDEDHLVAIVMFN